jgi:hypothetical protein
LKTKDLYIKASGGGAPVCSPGCKPFKTGAVFSYDIGDDGDLKSGAGVDFFTLDVGVFNVFGGSDRFTDIFGGQTYTNGIVLNHSTDNNGEILGIDRNTLAGGGEPYQPTATLSHSVGGFSSGWMLWNTIQAANFASNGNGIDFDYFPLNGTNSQGVTYWVSRTYFFDPNYAHYISGNGTSSLALKANLSAINVAVRYFTHAELNV